MTDYKLLIKFLKQSGVTYSEENVTNADKSRDEIKITITAKENKKVVGYLGFQTEYHFTKKGGLIEIGIWE